MSRSLLLFYHAAFIFCCLLDSSPLFQDNFLSFGFVSCHEIMFLLQIPCGKTLQKSLQSHLNNACLTLICQPNSFFYWPWPLSPTWPVGFWKGKKKTTLMWFKKILNIKIFNGLVEVRGFLSTILFYNDNLYGKCFSDYKGILCCWGKLSEKLTGHIVYSFLNTVCSCPKAIIRTASALLNGPCGVFL